MRRYEKKTRDLLIAFLITVLMLNMACSINVGLPTQKLDPRVTILVQTAVVEVTSTPPPATSTPEVPLTPDPPTVTPTPEASATPLPPPTATPILHAAIPVAHGWYNSSLWDSSCRNTGPNKVASSGDFFVNNWFERPFMADMSYLPFIDIEQADLSFDTGNIWVYADLWLVEPPAGYADQNPMYGLEIDTNRNARGDYLILAALPPSSEWTTNGVKVYHDTNQDVGSTRPIVMDAPVNGNGYDKLIFDSGVGDDPDLAWVRISPSDGRAIEIAFKNTLVGPEKKFYWGAWADAAMQKPEWMDYNDHFTQAEAGNPNPEMGYYPLKAFFGVDNTCRMGVGFDFTGNELGACMIAQPTAVPEQPSYETPVPTEFKIPRLPLLPLIPLIPLLTETPKPIIIIK